MSRVSPTAGDCTTLESGRDPCSEVLAALGGQRQFQHVHDITWFNNIKTSLNARQLTGDEIERLQSNGNSCLPGVSWSSIRTTASQSFQVDFVRGCRFGANCVFGNFSREEVCKIDGYDFPCGLYNSTIIDSALLDHCLVRDTKLVAGCVVGRKAVVFGCGNIVYSPTRNGAEDGVTCGNGSFLPLGVETGGRDTPIFAEQTLEDIAIIAGNRGNHEQIRAYEEAVRNYVKQTRCMATILADESMLLNCSKIRNSFIGYKATVDSSTVLNSSILSGQEPGENCVVSGGALVENSILQWGCHIDSMAIVSKSLMCTHSHADRHGKVIESVIGPCTGISEGEVTASLVGPFVGFHHQSLLIASFWPAGRGNIGYGANVGSNHTGKQSDQELWPGEGTFFGLATAIKFPSNFSHAPYCLIATGVTTLPQKVEMPFSLINAPGEVIPGISPALNEITPGWTLHSNLYMILRNESKFKKRRKKVIGRVQYEYEILRPDTVELLRNARAELQRAEGKARFIDSGGAPIYTDKEAIGIGKNYMKESSRVLGIETYTRFIQFYCLRTMFRALQEGSSPESLFSPNVRDLNVSGKEHGLSVLTDTLTLQEENTSNKYSTQWFSYGKGVFMTEVETGVFGVKDGLRRFDEMNAEIAVDVIKSKQKDDKRGPKIIDGYGDAHSRADDDPVVKDILHSNKACHSIVLTYLSSM